jgi:hypothetical protein
VRIRHSALATLNLKNKHRHRPAGAGLWPQVFHGGPFGVWGTPPAKPLNCKVWEIPNDARAIHACRSGFSFSSSKIGGFSFRYSLAKQKPCLLSVSRVYKVLIYSLPACLHRIQVDPGFLDFAVLRQTGAQPADRPAMTCRFRD